MSSQVWKNGDQSIHGTSSASGIDRLRVPTNAGAGVYGLTLSDGSDGRRKANVRDEVVDHGDARVAGDERMERLVQLHVVDGAVVLVKNAAESVAQRRLEPGELALVEPPCLRRHGSAETASSRL